MKTTLEKLAWTALLGAAVAAPAAPLTSPIVDTGQVRCYDNRQEIAYPPAGAAFHGQDAEYAGNQPAYRDNGDGTVSDLVTGLTWTQNPGEKKTYAEAIADARTCRVGGHTDWRLPTIKELYSLIQFSGSDPNPMSRDEGDATPFIDRSVFHFQYGKAEDGDRIIDSQFATCTLYGSTTMDGNKTMFGVNFADGRIKGYPIGRMRGGWEKTYYALYVRGNPAYGKKRFVDNRDGTVTDRATGLTWQQADSGRAMDWEDALAYAEGLALAGHDDWRLPNAKELQSIVDYERCPDVTGSPAIDPVFSCTPIRNEAARADFAYYWTGTTHTRAGGDGAAAVYVAFGRALGYLHGRWMDVHGAGAQRSDPKEGQPSDFPQGLGPQGDARRAQNFVRCVHGGAAEPKRSGPPVEAPTFRQQRPGSRPMEGRQQGGHGGATMQPPGTGGPPGFVEHLDRDGDGRVSAAEFDGPADQFRVLDRNHDGYLTEDEAPPPPRRGGRPRPDRRR